MVVVDSGDELADEGLEGVRRLRGGAKDFGVIGWS